MDSKEIRHRIILVIISIVCFNTMKGMSFDLDSIASSALIHDNKSALANGLFSTEIKFGWRFRL